MLEVSLHFENISAYSSLDKNLHLKIPNQNCDVVNTPKSRA